MGIADPCRNSRMGITYGTKCNLKLESILTELSHNDWQKRAKAVTFKTQAFIGGKWVDAASGKRFDVVNPATNQVIASVAECDAEDVNRAVKAARAAFTSG